MSPHVISQREQLLETLRSYGPCVVAFSGGVDSAVVAQAAQLAWGDAALAVTGQSPSLAQGELEAAVALARHIGIRHEIVATSEFEQPSYTQNAPDRCFHCKTELYSQLQALRARLPDGVTLVNGANLDDLADYRPGLQAARDFHVRSPLAECKLRKSDVRALAAHWNLPVWDKPASPCLSSRVAYGEEVTPERLAMIDAAEQHLRTLGVSNVRVRYHRGDLARIEVPLEALAHLCNASVRDALVARFMQLGFRFITLDLAGFRSGSLNALVELRLP